MNYLHRICLYLSAQGGTTLLSLVVLGAALSFNHHSAVAAVPLFVALAIIRLGYFHFFGPPSLLTGLVVRKRLSTVLADETVITLSLIAVSVIAAWPMARATMLVFFFANAILQVGWMRLSRSLLRAIVRLGRRHRGMSQDKQAVIVGSGPRAQRVADIILRSPELQTNIVGFFDYNREDLWRYRDIPLLGHPGDLVSIGMTQQIDAVIIAVEPEEIPLTRELFHAAEQMGVTLCVMPDFYESAIARPRTMWLNGTSTLVYRAVPENKVAIFAKTVVDRIGAVAGLILASPIMLLTAIAIKLDSRGPVLFTQRRTGLNGRVFNLYKFRTMCDDAERLKSKLRHANEMTGPVFKMKSDPRITAVGKLLRKFSIDELPQFINVLRGEMSLVGPRPPLPSEVEQYEPWQRRRLSVKPGVTCTWQVSGRNRIDFEEWMHLDLQYIDNWSLWQDTKILARTIPAVFKGDGAS